MDVKKTEWVQSTARGYTYGFLSRIFKDETTFDIWEELFSGEGIAEVKRVLQQLPQGKGEELLSILEKIEAELQAVPVEYREKESLELRKEFAFLFLTPHGVSPFESVYRGRRNMLMDKPWERVRAFYKKLGLEKDKSEIHPEDHAAVELGFLSTLAYLSSNRFLVAEDNPEENGMNRGALLEVQRDFLMKHAACWIPELCKDIAARARHRFFRSVSPLAGRFVRLDLELLEELLREKDQVKSVFN